jgi:hypothetical protein
MKKSTFIFVFLMIIFGSQVKAQNTLDNLGLSSSTPASVAYSLRKLSSSYSGPLVRILLGSSYYDVYPDTTTNQFFSLTSPVSASYSNYNDAETGATATLLSSLITGSTSARVAIWYDQSGNGIDVMTSSINGPIIIDSGAIQTMNGKPTVYFASVNHSTSQLVSSNTVDFTSQTAATINAVVQNVGSIDYISGIISTGYSGGWGLNYDPTNSINGYWIDGSGCTNANSGDTSNVSKIVTGIIDIDQNANTSSIYENNTLKQTRNSICGINHTSTDNICIGIRAANGGARVFDGYISEVMIFSSYLSSTNRNYLENNQNVTYFSPSISIVSSDTNNSICSGDSVTFTASSYNVNNPTYQWYLNGNVINGATASAFSSTTLANNDTIYVVMDVSGTPLTSNSISTTVSNSSLVTSAIKLSTGATTVTSLTSNLTWDIDNTLNDDHSLFQITSGHDLSFINPAVYGQSNTYSVSVISGCSTKNITVTISPFCGNWDQGGDGLTQATAGSSAYQIKQGYPNSQDGVYWINLANVGPTQIYCIMNSDFDGGGWMLAMKATTGPTFYFDADYWTSNNTLNPTDTNRNDGDAKFETMNNFQAKDIMAIWPDISNINSESGSIDNLSNWTWLQNNFHANGSRTTLINKFLGSQVDYYSSTDGSMIFSGYGSVFSSQGGYSFYGINYTNRPDAKVRWGFAWNNEQDENTNDVSGGIGMDSRYGNYSAGDRINCCEVNNGINRSARVELYVR